MQYIIPVILLIHFLGEGIKSILPESLTLKYPELHTDISMYLIFGSIALFIILGIVGHLLPYFQTSKIWFGKYKGAKWKSIPKSYLEWISYSYDDHNRTFALRELKRRASFESSKTSKAIKIEPEKEILHKYENTLLGIIEANRVCWKCHKKTKVIALKFYTNMNGNDSYSTTPKVEHFIQHIDDSILDVIQSKYPFYKYRFSKSIQTTYLANCCSHCNMLQGDFQLYQEPDGPFVDAYRMKCNQYLVLADGGIKFSSRLR